MSSRAAESQYRQRTFKGFPDPGGALLETAGLLSPPTSAPARARRTLLTNWPGRSSWFGFAVASRNTAA